MSKTFFGRSLLKTQIITLIFSFFTTEENSPKMKVNLLTVINNIWEEEIASSKKGQKEQVRLFRDLKFQFHHTWASFARIQLAGSHWAHLSSGVHPRKLIVIGVVTASVAADAQRNMLTIKNSGSNLKYKFARNATKKFKALRQKISHKVARNKVKCNLKQ